MSLKVYSPSGTLGPWKAKTSAVAGGMVGATNAVVPVFGDVAEVVVRWAVGYGVEVLIDGVPSAYAPLDVPFAADLTEATLHGPGEAERCDQHVELPGVIARDL